MEVIEFSSFVIRFLEIDYKLNICIIYDPKCIMTIHGSLLINFVTFLF